MNTTTNHGEMTFNKHMTKIKSKEVILETESD